MNHSATEPDDTSSEHNDTSLKEAVLTVLKPLASLQVTVVLFLLGLVLVFFGTMAQMDEGIWTVVDKYFRSDIVRVPFQLVAKFLIIFFKWNPDAHWHGSFPFPGGWTIGFALLANLLAAHAVRFRFTWKRAGILVIHSGMVLLMLGELITGLYAVESTMTLAIGESSNFVDETLAVELAIAHPVDSQINDVVKIPQHMLKNPGVIKHPDLPVDVEIVEYWKNSSLEERSGPAPDGEWIQLGNGNVFKVTKRPEEAGVEMNQRGDAPSVRVKLLKKGTNDEVATFLLSLWYYPNSTMNSRLVLFPPFQFDLDGKQYTIELRNKRDYKPYTIHLLKFEHAKYEQTDIAKDFASTVEVIDPQGGPSREARIWMNNPLRYEGESFYQLSVLRADSGTVLQVVRNPGRILPYLSCALVVLGLLIHFGMQLVRFLRRKDLSPSWKTSAVLGVITGHVSLGRQTRPQPAEEGGDSSRRVPGLERFVPLLVVVLAALWLVSKAIPPEAAPDRIDYYQAGEIPVLNGGRMKPLDTVARTNLQAISGRTEVQDDNRKFAASAMQWYIDVFDSHDMFSGKAADYKIFRIDNDQVLSLLQLKPKPEFFRYSLKELEPRIGLFDAELKKVQAKGDKKLDLRDTKILDLGKKIHLYQKLAAGQLPNIVPPLEDGQEWLTMEEVDKEVPFDNSEKEAAFDQARETIVAILKEQNIDIAKMGPEAFRRAQQMLPMLAQKMLSDSAPEHRDRVRASAAAVTELMRKGKSGDAKSFREALATYRQNDLYRVTPEQMRNIRLESFFNHFAPFYQCSMLYVMVIIIGCLSWLVWRDVLNPTAFWLGVLTFLLHTFALGMRMYIQDRPPVTNLYSSAVFIGWGCMLLCLVLERIFRNGIGIIVGSILGALTMMIAHFLSEGGDTMEMLQAVLDTNFWLATHVTIVTMGYMSTLVAGMIAILYILGGIFTKEIDAEMNKSFGQMIYGVICFATLLSFTGTVLGGIWADYSWGRFWGWDAKENGAVMVVIWNTLILHARWAGLVKLRGVALLCLGGIMITFWSWFGTNQLGAGLHSYGFSTELAERCMWVWVSMTFLIVVGLAVPTRYWRSFSDEAIRERLANAKSLTRSRSPA